MTTPYKITSWSQVIDSDNILRPVITFEPDLDFLAYLQDNHYSNPIAVCIQGSQWYDGNHFATCLSSKDFPAYGPNYFSVTRNYVLILDDVEFSFYPGTTGDAATFTINFSVRSPGFSCVNLDNNEGKGEEEDASVSNHACDEEREENQEEFSMPDNYGDSVHDQSWWQTGIFWVVVSILVFVLTIMILVAVFTHWKP